jgi:hypothetical protein
MNEGKSESDSMGIEFNERPLRRRKKKDDDDWLEDRRYYY